MGVCYSARSVPFEDSDEEHQMNPQVWEKLPEDVLQKVLAKLSLPDLNRVRRVCKQWNLWVLSSRILQKCPIRRTVLLNWRHGTLTAYNSRRNSWEKVNLLFLPVRSDFLWLVASGGGLLCFEIFGGDAFGDFVICNPVTKKWRQLHMPSSHDQQPSLPSQLCKGAQMAGREMVAGMVVYSTKLSDSERARTYKLIVAGSYAESNGRTHVFDSATGTWKEVARVPRGRFYDQAISCNGDMYCLMDLGSRLLKYTVQSETWSEVIYELPSCSFPHYLRVQLVELSGRVLLLTRGSDSQRSYRFLELRDSGSELWLTAIEMPKSLVSCLSGTVHLDNKLGLRCAGLGDVMYLWQEEGSACAVKKLVVFNVSSNSCTGFSNWTMYSSVHKDWHVIIPSLESFL